jgi:hypothetical protein
MAACLRGFFGVYHPPNVLQPRIFEDPLMFAEPLCQFSDSDLVYPGGGNWNEIREAEGSSGDDRERALPNNEPPTTIFSAATHKLPAADPLFQ